jgi:subtilisin family serine protease
VVAALASLAACAPSRREERPPIPKPNVDPARSPRAPVRVPPEPPPVLEPPPERIAPPEVAAANGWMPLASTGVERFRREHPTADGRGVLIAILDTGVDPAVPGLGATTTGQPKIADLRDFSNEGAVALSPVTAKGDTIEIGGRLLGGVSRVRALAGDGPFFGGVVAELPLGVAPAADLNGNGVVRDTLPLLVARGTGGWVVFADRDGDGSLAGERPVGDFLRGREWLGWSPRGASPPVGIGVNLDEADGRPRLTLVYDLDSHGTHVAGIAAGHRIYGAAGLDGAAPGAQILGLKISNAGQGSVSTTGAIVRALDYAIRFAAERRQPLVVNLSFGVGNEIEGGARIDRMVDSVLRRHPEIVLTVSAGNDGPGMSTVGFPGSTPRALVVGATIPRNFLAPRADGTEPPEPIAFFSARGGEVAKPDLVAPGVAYSTVPRWDAGDEVKQGTSMAAPQIAGAAALLVSAFAERKASADGAAIRQALMATATPVAGASLVEGGRGVPDVEAAYQWLLRPARQETVDVRGPNGVDGALVIVGPGRTTPDKVEFRLRREASGARTFRLRSDAPWLRAPERVAVADSATVSLRLDPAALTPPGTSSATVSGWPEDTLAGPAFRLPVTVIRPAALRGARTALMAGTRVGAGGLARSPFIADSARPFAVQVTGGAADQGLAFLHEPHGRPFRGGGVLALTGGQPARFQVDAEDVVPGSYEAVVSSSISGPMTVALDVLQSPVELRLERTGERTLTAGLLNREAGRTRAEVSAALRGAESRQEVVGRGPSVYQLPVTAPDWARRLVIDVEMDRDQWGRVTDFGATLFDSTGRRLETDPLQYATGRTTLALEPGAERRLRLDLLPGFADPADSAEWRVHVIVRAYADREIPLAAANGAQGSVSLAPGASALVAFTLPDVSWPLGDGYHPLGAVVVSAGGERWTRESGLPLVSRTTMQ